MTDGNIILDLPAPTEKQKLFCRADTRYVVYGGARGGGKSFAVRYKATLLAAKYRGIRILILRRTYPELWENHISQLIQLTVGAAKYRDKDKTLVFVNGSKIKFGYCQSDSDVLQYQGQEYDCIFIDEATQFSEYQFTWFDACVRGVNGFPKRTYITANPGGIGHVFIKKRFLDMADVSDDITYIPARVYDNAPLMAQNPGYIKTLECLPDGLRDAWLNGNWDSYVGQYFAMFDKDIHVINPVDLPERYRRYIALDYGLDMLAVVWIAVDAEGYAYVYREYCAPDTIISQAASDILRLTGGEHIDYIYAPPDLWSRSQESGKSKADLFADYGLVLDKSDNSRESGWLSLAEWLTPVGDKPPRLRIFNGCRELIRCLPLLQRDARRPSDCSTEPHEITHITDALRYFTVMHILAGKPELPQKSVLSDYKRRVLNGSGRRYRFN